MTKSKALYVVSIVLLLSLTLGGVLQAQSNRSVFGWVIADRATVQSGGLTVTGDSVLAATTIDVVTVTDDANLNDSIIADYEVVSPQPVLTLVMNGWITPTGTFQPIRSAAAVNISGARIAPGIANGQLLRLFNIGAQTVVITETLTSGVGLISAGNRTVGPGDTLTLVYSGTTWIQTGNSDN